MHVCIIGTGAAGWISYHVLKKHPAIKKITVIGSPTIATVGVGESTTLPFHRFIHRYLGLSREDICDLLLNIDAAIKYGVTYEGWSKNRFLHHFGGEEEINRDILQNTGYLLGNKPQDTAHDEYAVPLSECIYNNQIYLDRSQQSYAYHFDAGKFIQAMEKLALRDNHIVYLQDTVVDLIYHEHTATHAVLQSGEKIQADYFVSCVGQTAFNQKLFGETYTSYSDILLTNKALFCPLEYTDQRSQFHPYTVARTMNCGWRWITPTLSRIGTGYAFSDRHISQSKAIDEFRSSVGDPNIEPFVVDFTPRKIKTSFRTNTCSLGLAGGFLEPLDAPGLTMIFNGLDLLQSIFDQINTEKKQYRIDQANKIIDRSFDFWCSFILHQYKTCTRNDSNFWKDQKSVSFPHYDKLLNEAFDPVIYLDTDAQQISAKYSRDMLDPLMFYNTTSGKDIPWKVKSSQSPEQKAIRNLNSDLLIHHRDYFHRLSEKTLDLT